MRFDILTLFPNLFESYLSDSILKRALDKKLIEINFHNIRDYSKDKHHKVDDTPYGGGAGMVMTCQPLFDCIKYVKQQNHGPVIFMTPQGNRLNQEASNKIATTNNEIILLCGRYEGIDQRVRDQLVDQEISIGNYVLTGGELPAMVLIDSISRQIPGVLGNEDSPHLDSFSKEFNGKKEYPQYTKPSKYKDLSVPEILLSGNHAEIEKWRKQNLK